jgi:phospho-N-acetylmuramoyl-pentapeptide-transferase
MLYHLFDYLKTAGIKVPGGALFQFITFRILLAVSLSLVITMLYGRRLINYLRNLQVGESVRELGLEGEQQKKARPRWGE